jgi:hypothetical protein
MSSLWKDDPIPTHTNPLDISWVIGALVIGGELALLWWLA